MTTTTSGQPMTRSTSTAAREFSWPKALNVTRHFDNYWHADVSFARAPTDSELQELSQFLNTHHENAAAPAAGEPVAIIRARDENINDAYEAVLDLQRDSNNPGVQLVCGHIMEILKRPAKERSATPQPAHAVGEPVAWAVLADNGNCRIWWKDKAPAESYSKAHDVKLTPLYATPQEPPTVGASTYCHCHDETSRRFCLTKNTCTPIAEAQAAADAAGVPEGQTLAKLRTSLEALREFFALHGEIEYAEIMEAHLRALDRVDEPAPPLATGGSVAADPLRDALQECMFWHERQDKALSKSGRSDADYHYRRDQHRDEIQRISSALLHAQPGGEASQGGAGLSSHITELLSEAEVFRDPAYDSYAEKLIVNLADALLELTRGPVR